MKKTKRMWEDENLEYENEYNEDDDHRSPSGEGR
jgi:hypothetical protein